MAGLFEDIGKPWLEWRGKDKAAPHYNFQDNEIVSPPYPRKVSRLWKATFVNLHPTHFAVAISPDGKMTNLKGGYNLLTPGNYNIHYVDKQNRVNHIPRTEEITRDGFKVAMELVISYRVIDPIKALFWSAVVNGIIAVPIMAILMMLAVKPEVMGAFVITRRLRVLGWLATAVMALVVVAMVATW